MRANRAFRLIVSRAGHEPALFAAPGRRDRIEIVSVDDGEVVLLWDLPVKQASKLLRTLRADFARLDADEFIGRWGGSDADD